MGSRYNHIHLEPQSLILFVNRAFVIMIKTRRGLGRLRCFPVRKGEDKPRHGMPDEDPNGEWEWRSTKPRNGQLDREPPDAEKSKNALFLQVFKGHVAPLRAMWHCSHLDSKRPAARTIENKLLLLLIEAPRLVVTYSAAAYLDWAAVRSAGAWHHKTLQKRTRKTTRMKQTVQ